MERHARTRGDARAVVEVGERGQLRAVNFAQLATEARLWEMRLRELGVGAGEPVAYQLPNVIDFVAVSLGALRIGAVCEPLMPIFRERELEFMLRESGSRVLVVPREFRGHDHAAMAADLRRRLASLEHVVVLPDRGPPPAEGAACDATAPVASPPVAIPPAAPVASPPVAIPPAAPTAAAPVATAPAAPPPAAPAAPPTNDAPDFRASAGWVAPNAAMTAQLLFTSGSTGEPKGVLQTHASLNLAARMHIRHFGLTASDVISVPSPLAHQTGFLYGMWIALMLGAPQVVQTRWDPEVAFDAMRETGVTFVQAATPFLADLVAVARRRGETLATLRIFVATGAAIPRELAREAREALGAQVGGAFGTTESCLGAAFVPGQDPELAWSADGRALDGITLRVTDEHGNELAPGEEGNFEVLTPTLFEGYLNRPELTAEALTPDGYYRTGDLARIDADGYLRITGRVKDVINRGGEKVPVVEIEQVLYAHPAVREVAIVAMPDERLGERACAFVVLQPGAELDFEGMQRHLEAQRVSKPYWPERLEIVAELPYTPSGKIQKFVLRDRIAAQLERKAVPR